MRLPKLHDWTPTFESIPLKQKIHKKVWLKMECFQTVGSYKIRGIGRLCEYWISHGKKHFICSSDGMQWRTRVNSLLC